MPWVRFDDQFPLHRKVKGLSDAAFRLHAEAIFWCARNLTDGFVPTEDISDVASARRPHKSIPELVRRDMWASNGDGWQIHDYLDFQPSKMKVEHERKAKAERQARWMAKRKPRDASRDATTDTSRDAAPPRPEKGGGGKPSPGRRSRAGAPNGASDERRKKITAQLEQARSDPEMRCTHGVEAGAFIRPDTGQSATCAQCRTEQRGERT